MPVESPARRLLAVKLADLGDSLLCEPALRSLRHAFPDAAIDVLTTPQSAQLITSLGHARFVLPFPKQLFDNVRGFSRPGNIAAASNLALRLRRARYDSVLIFHHLTTSAGAAKFRLLAMSTTARHVIGLDNGRGAFLTDHVVDRGFGAMHEVDYMLEVARRAGGADVDPRPRFPARGDVGRFNLPSEFAVIFPATGPYSPARAWTADRYASLARTLERDRMRCVIAGGRDASKAASKIRESATSSIDITGKTSLAELATVVEGASFIVGGDSFIGHLAAALERPLVSIFGPSNVEAWKPYGARDLSTSAANRGERRVVVRAHLPCEPCLYTGYRLGRPDGCPDRTCMRHVSVADVAGAIRIVTAGSR